MRFFFIAFIALVSGYLFLQGSAIERSSEKPVFLRLDNIAMAHKTSIDLTIHSEYIPDSLQLQILKKDYSNLWAHLNHLYATNDINAGKEYYTESWFRQIAGHFEGVQETIIARMDEHHELHIQNWASDGLVCTAIDSNVVFAYTYPDEKIEKTRANLAIVLLFQGDHWRIDALKVLDETHTN